MEIKEPKFNRLEEVYHVSPGSGKGIILDITYYFSTKSFKYYVTFGVNNDAWCIEEELYSRNK